MDRHNYEYSGDMSDWPRNESGKPTQAAVFGVMHPQRGKVCEILWTGQFPDLEPAMYWAAKKEMHAVRKDKWIMATRVLWQHGLTPEEAVQSCFKNLSPQIDDALKAIENDEEYEGGPGMMPVDPTKAQGYYVEVVDKNDEEGDPLASFIAPPPANDVEIEWLTGGSKDKEADAGDHIPNDPREPR
jgi:hypothetical protein